MITSIKLTVSLEEARVLYKYLKSNWVMPEDQRIVYDFVHRLDGLIQQSENQNAREGHMDK